MGSEIPHIHVKNRVLGVAGQVFGLDLLLDTQALMMEFLNARRIGKRECWWSVTRASCDVTTQLGAGLP